MSLVNNGYQRATSITITPTINGVSQTPTVISILDEFRANGTSHISILDSEFASMSSDDYNTRMTDFIAYVNSNHAGLAVTAAGSRVYNTTACPIS